MDVNLILFFFMLIPADAEIIITHEIGHVLGLVGTVGQICAQSCTLNYYFPYECPLANFEYNALNLNKGPLLLDPGSCGHWSEWSFAVERNSELMTPYFEENLAQPLSRVSIAALDDSFSDYVVDYEAADPFPIDRRMLRTSAFKVLVPTSNFTLSEDRMLHLSQPIPLNITPDEM